MSSSTCFLYSFTCFLVLSILSCTHVQSQNQSMADSLEIIYERGNYKKDEKLKLLKELSGNHPQTQKKLQYSDELIQYSTSIDSVDYLLTGYLNKGTALRLKGDYSEALESYFEAAKIAIDLKQPRNEGIVNVVIADVYSVMGNHNMAIDYYHLAISLLKKENDSLGVASALLNAGDEFFNHGDLDSALVYFEKSGEMFQKLKHESGLAYNLGNLGLVYAELGDNVKAEKNIVEAVRLLEEVGDYYPVSVYLTFMSDIYFEKGEDSIALSFANRSLELAKSYDLKEQISDAYLKLAELHEELGNTVRSFAYYRDHIKYRDSINNVEAVQEMASLRLNFEMSRKQTEVDLLNEQQKNQKLLAVSIGTASLLLALLAFGLYRRNEYIKNSSKIIEVEKGRSDNLLLNILPEETAKELKQSGRVKAKKFDSVTVLFADFLDFTKSAENLTPEELIKTLDHYFSNFDKIIEKYGVEKIKTVGDCYMAAAGLPFPSEDHAEKMLMAALEMTEFVKRSRKHMVFFDVRIGLSSGPVIAGVVGTKKFAYDIWGDTVNIASRMETYSEAGRINISKNTYKLVKDTFICEDRGEIEVKHKGVLNMYFVNGRKG